MDDEVVEKSPQINQAPVIEGVHDISEHDKSEPETSCKRDPPAKQIAEAPYTDESTASGQLGVADIQLRTNAFNKASKYNQEVVSMQLESQNENDRPEGLVHHNAEHVMKATVKAHVDPNEVLHTAINGNNNLEHLDTTTYPSMLSDVETSVVADDHNLFNEQAHRLINQEGACNRDKPKNFACMSLPSKYGRSFMWYVCGMARPNEQQNGKGCTPEKLLPMVNWYMDQYDQEVGNRRSKLALISLDHMELGRIHNAALQVGIEPYSSYLGTNLVVEDFHSPSIEQITAYIARVLTLGEQQIHVITHCAAGMGRTGLFLISLVAVHCALQATREHTWQDSFICSIDNVQQNYHPNAGEFDEVKGNFKILCKVFVNTQGKKFHNLDYRSCFDFRGEFMNRWLNNRRNR
eukprot:gnl/MRDRNA2_/MRDRNA2_15228_c0_seq1.p1 gnl/MRDRNA2_/MRDRNA2_15228_c0~~gnl/MRDRNA2_/MRDRNA2_15228_c0_seq1.p1  ORF type:complete len:434 (-),score=70.00 gnl/MRDRNA2_/MRDRNA2_15228_c0_seq1:23-1243(-)